MDIQLLYYMSCAVLLSPRDEMLFLLLLWYIADMAFYTHTSAVKGVDYWKKKKKKKGYIYCLSVQSSREPRALSPVRKLSGRLLYSTCTLHLEANISINQSLPQNWSWYSRYHWFHRDQYHSFSRNHFWGQDYTLFYLFAPEAWGS